MKKNLILQHVFLPEAANRCFFLLNIVLNIKKFAAEYCCCKDNFQICLVCQAKYFYRDYKYKIYKNNLHLHFLAELQKNVSKNFSRLTIIDSHFVYCLINEEHIDSHPDWFNGQYHNFSLRYCIDPFENKKIDQIKKNKCKIIIEPLDLKEYLQN